MPQQPPPPSRYRGADSAERGYQRVRLRQDTLENWLKNDPVLASGEMGYVIGSTAPNEMLKCGDGTVPWSQLPYLMQQGNSGPPGPSGLDGHSITVYGPSDRPPSPANTQLFDGDIWLSATPGWPGQPGFDATIVTPGAKGDKGDAANIQIGVTTKLPFGSLPTVTNVGSPQSAILEFAIPEGPMGQIGLRGPVGPKGDQGPAGQTFTVAGAVANEASLPPSPPNLSVYITQDNAHLHIYDTASAAAGPNGYVDLGAIAGPRGASAFFSPPVATAADLPSPGAEGQCILALDTGHMHSWDAANGVWVDAGKIVGPASSNIQDGTADGDILAWDSTANAWLPTGASSSGGMFKGAFLRPPAITRNGEAYYQIHDADVPVGPGVAFDPAMVIVLQAGAVPSTADPTLPLRDSAGKVVTLTPGFVFSYNGKQYIVRNVAELINRIGRPENTPDLWAAGANPPVEETTGTQHVVGGLYYSDAGGWARVPQSLTDLDDTDARFALGGSVLTYDSSASKWVATAPTNMAASHSPTVFQGTQAFSPADIGNQSLNYGMASDTVPDPKVFHPKVGDIYINREDDDVVYFEGMSGGHATLTAIYDEVSRILKGNAGYHFSTEDNGHTIRIYQKTGSGGLVVPVWARDELHYTLTDIEEPQYTFTATNLRVTWDHDCNYARDFLDDIKAQYDSSPMAAKWTMTVKPLSEWCHQSWHCIELTPNWTLPDRGLRPEWIRATGFYSNIPGCRPGYLCEQVAHHVDSDTITGNFSVSAPLTQQFERGEFVIRIPKTALSGPVAMRIAGQDTTVAPVADLSYYMERRDNAQSGDALAFDGKEWKPTHIDVDKAMSDLTDTDFPAGGYPDGSVIVWDGTSAKWKLLTKTGVGPQHIGELQDVTISGATDKQVLAWDAVNSVWTNASKNLDWLSDVTLSSPADKQVLQYESASNQWKNVTPDYLNPTNGYTKTEVDNKVTSIVTGLEHYESVLSRTDTPPASPAVNSFYIVGATPTGVWAGQANNLARWDGTAWQFEAPVANESHLVEDVAETWHWNGTGWVKVATATTTGGPAAAGELWMVGAIQQSLLTEDEFKTLLPVAEQTKWVLADGRNVSGSTYATTTGRNKIPDLRGAFLRMAGTNSNPNWVGGNLNGWGEDTTRRPRNTALTGVTSSDGSHRHHLARGSYSGNFSPGISYADAAFSTVNNSGSNAIDAGDRAVYPNGDHAHTVTINGGGDTETAPKHYKVNYFIKIN